MSFRCQGTTRQGERCWNDTQEVGDFCTIHKPGYVRPTPKADMDMLRALDFADDRAQTLSDSAHSMSIRAGLEKMRRRMDK